MNSTLLKTLISLSILILFFPYMFLIPGELWIKLIIYFLVIIFGYLTHVFYKWIKRGATKFEKRLIVHTIIQIFLSFIFIPAYFIIIYSNDWGLQYTLKHNPIYYLYVILLIYIIHFSLLFTFNLYVSWRKNLNWKEYILPYIAHTTYAFIFASSILVIISSYCAQFLFLIAAIVYTYPEFMLVLVIINYFVTKSRLKKANDENSLNNQDNSFIKSLIFIELMYLFIFGIGASIIISYLIIGMGFSC